MSEFKVKQFEDPRDKDDSNRIVWTTAKVQKAIESMELGYQVAHAPFYEGDINYRKGNTVFDYTEEEMAELKKCAKDIVYFANTYCHAMTDEGVRKIQLRDYQAEMLKQYQENRWNVTLASRQIGKTICSGIFIAWYSLFNFDKNAMIMANKGATTKEILMKAKHIYENLPFFLKPGILKKDVMEMRFDNGCRVIGQNTTKTGGISFTIHLLYLDEFAHIMPSIINPFYENVYPTLSSSKISRVIITSTPNGYNKFHDIYQNAVDGNNEYAPFRVDWWQVPGRDEKWKEQEIANLGSIEAFNQQYNNQFLSASSLLLSSVEMKKLKNNEQEFVFHEFDGLDDLGIDYSSLKWDQKVDPDNLDGKQDFYLFSVDLAEGVGKDYTVINIFKILPMDIKFHRDLVSPSDVTDFFKLEQIGIFRSNVHSLKEVSQILYEMCVNIFDQENLRCIIEYNAFGQEVINNLIQLYPTRNDFDEEILVRYAHRVGSKIKKPGIKVNRDNKRILTTKVKNYIRTSRMIVKDPTSVSEAAMFSRNENGTYSAQTGNDDCMMTIVNACSFFDTVDYSETVEELFDYIPQIYKTEIEKTLESSGNLSGDSFNIYDILE
jgi:hypothetical protein